MTAAELDTLTGRRVAEGHCERRSDSLRALHVAQHAAWLSGVAVGMWRDGTGYLLTRLDNPVTRAGVPLVLKVRPNR